MRLRVGKVRWSGVRPASRVAMTALSEVRAHAAGGLDGDRYHGSSGARGITLLQAEHLPAIAALVGRFALDPALLRRNVVVEGIPLNALVGVRFQLGEVLALGTDTCDPCDKMDDALGPGGRAAMTGIGGITAKILEGGVIRVGDAVTAY